MNDTDTIKGIISKLPHKLMSFVLSENWRETANQIDSRFNLDEAQCAALENEIFFVLIGLRDPNDLTKNIKEEINIDLNMIGWIVEDIEKNILLKVEDEIASLWQEKSKGNGVAESFEEMVESQAKAMRPAQAPPDNLPGAEVEKGENEEKPKVIHNYIGEADPYREAAE